MGKENFRIVFMGTSDFAVPSLEAIVNSEYHLAAVITAPDREAGRGRKIQHSPVKEFALQQGLKILQPVNLKDPAFQNELRSLRPDLQVVVAFRMLPRPVWELPAKGTINLHASLLPNYRGAAPINHVIINGETQTGLTTFYIDEKIDTGSIIRQVPTDIGPEESFGDLYQRLRGMSPSILMQTVNDIYTDHAQAISQDELKGAAGELMPAPKIFKEDCKIRFDQPLDEIHNFIRGLSPYPAAFTEIHQDDKSNQVKIFKTSRERADHSDLPGRIVTDNKSWLKVSVLGGYLHIHELQLAGKKKLSVVEFLNGQRISSGAFFA